MNVEWKIAFYLRLSNDDGDKAESNSISSQRDIINDFVKKYMKNYEIVNVFIDDGYTGTNFNRPEFKKMVRSIEDTDINCIIVKDLSRFGRDYIGVGNYLERFFPLHDVRFIAINDNYDSLSSSDNDDFVMPIKNIFNAQYSKDISKKVKSSFKSLQRKGDFVGSFACYGYMKDNINKHKLIVDEPAAIIVRRIFNLFVSGQGKISIARILNDYKIPCPSEYKKLNGLNYNNGQKIDLTKYWTYSTINNILKNRMYIGDMVQNKSYRKFVRGKAKQNDKSDWIIVEDTHEPIVDKHTWEMAQTLLGKNTRQIDFNQNIGLFAGFIECGDCHRAMSKIINKYKKYTVTQYICGTYKRYGSKTCYRNAIKEKDLEQIVLNKINEQIQKIDHFNKNNTNESKNYTKEINKLEIMISKIKNKKRKLYESYSEDLITKEEYKTYKKSYDDEEMMMQSQLDSMLLEKDNDCDENDWIDKINKYKSIDKLTREIVAELVDKIIISKNKDHSGITVKVIFKFKFL